MTIDKHLRIGFSVAWLLLTLRGIWREWRSVKQHNMKAKEELLRRILK